MFEFKTRKRVTPNINLAALVDVVSILVIFIVLGANFHRIQTLDVSIPVAESTGQVKSSSLVITIPASGQLDLQGKKLIRLILRTNFAQKQLNLSLYCCWPINQRRFNGLFKF